MTKRHVQPLGDPTTLTTGLITPSSLTFPGDAARRFMQVR
jgi:hypothetical protein